MKRILIIEDDQSIAELERDYFEINGYEVHIEADGAKGLQLVRKEAFDLIILDLMLPQVNGFEICRQVRSFSDTPIILVSANVEDISKIKALGLGADDYVTKPFSPGELVARVKAHLSRFDRLIGKNPERQQADEINIRELRIDRSARRAFIKETELVLTTKEFELLAWLASHPDRVFTKEQLYESIWGQNSFGDMSTVSVHIGKLRDKLEFESPGETMIETVWGVGYRFKK